MTDIETIELKLSVSGTEEAVASFDNLARAALRASEAIGNLSARLDELQGMSELLIEIDGIEEGDE